MPCGNIVHLGFASFKYCYYHCVKICVGYRKYDILTRLLPTTDLPSHTICLHNVYVLLKCRYVVVKLSEIRALFTYNYIYIQLWPFIQVFTTMWQSIVIVNNHSWLKSIFLRCNTLHYLLGFRQNSLLIVNLM